MARVNPGAIAEVNCTNGSPHALQIFDLSGYWTLFNALQIVQIFDLAPHTLHS